MTTTTVLVTLPSGAPFEVLNDDEADQLEGLVRKYQEQFTFTHVSDVQDLDRVIFLEVLIYRWARWSSSLQNYDGGKVDQVDLQKRIREFSGELRQIKKLLGMDAPTREKSKGEGSVPHYLAKLRAYAAEFGIHREKQLDKALELANQLIGITTVWQNCEDEAERRLLHHTTDDIIDWITTVFVPEYQAIDAHFRQNQQRAWVREL